MPGYLDELESMFSDDLDVRLRLAIGRYGTAEQTPSVAGEWSRFAALLDSLQYSRDPLASSSFLAMASVAARFAGNYTLSRKLAERAVRMCRELRFDLGLGASLLHLTAAELGLRSFARAQRSLAAFERTSISREDPFYLVEGLTLRARLLAHRGSLQAAIDTHGDLAGIVAPPRALGSHLAAHSVLLAARGDAEQARRMAIEARRNGSSIVMTYLTQLAETIAEDLEGNDERFKARAAEVVVACDEASYLDGLVFAYRAYPRILLAAKTQVRPSNILATLLARSRDHELARAVGIELRIDKTDDPLGSLTRREREVLELLYLGMANHEIATRLFIAQSTTKVHVRHILRKLGVRTRLQAALRAQEILEAESR
jgi:ATP/maltotriose-dependent transcriptional regulator MalT